MTAPTEFPTTGYGKLAGFYFSLFLPTFVSIRISCKFMKIAKDTLVKLTYTLRFDKADGEVIEEIGEKDAMDIVVGHDVLLESFEAKIMGLQAGDTFAFSLNPQEAYGEYDEEKLVRVPKAELLEGLPEEAAENIYEGNIIPIVDADETTYEALITEIQDDIVSLDFNHPLSGETLFFEGKILAVRQATEAEIKAL